MSVTEKWLKNRLSNIKNVFLCIVAFPINIEMSSV